MAVVCPVYLGSILTTYVAERQIERDREIGKQRRTQRHTQINRDREVETDRDRDTDRHRQAQRHTQRDRESTAVGCLGSSMPAEPWPWIPPALSSLLDPTHGKSLAVKPPGAA